MPGDLQCVLGLEPAALGLALETRDPPATALPCLTERHATSLPRLSRRPRGPRRDPPLRQRRRAARSPRRSARRRRPVLLQQPHALDAEGREGREGAAEPGPGDRPERRVAVVVVDPAPDQAEQQAAADVHDERAPRPVASPPLLHAAVEQEAGDRTGGTGERHPHHGHRRRPRSPATSPAAASASPSTRVSSRYARAPPTCPWRSRSTVSTSYVLNVVQPPRTPVPSAGRR